jgi:hypothetical protein
MLAKDPFSPLNRDDRLIIGWLTGLTGVATLAFAVFMLIRGATPIGVVVALVLVACGAFALVLARRLFTNQSPYEEGHLVSPRLTLAIGVLFVVVAVGNALMGSFQAVWLLAPGIAAIGFGWSRRSAKRSRKSRSDGA